MTYVKEADGDVVLEVGSGRYAFAVDQVLGDLGAARARAASFSDDVDALQVRGLGKIAKGHLQVRTALMRSELSAAWRLQSEGADERLTAAAAHRALAGVADLDRWTQTYAEQGAIDKTAAKALRDALTGIEQPLSRASSRLVGAVATLEVPAGEILPGDVVRVKVALKNTGKQPLTGVDSSLRAPGGWTVKSVGRHASTTGAGSTLEHAYDVTVAADAQASVADLTGSVSYQYAGGTATLPVSAGLVVAPGVAIDGVSTTPDPAGPGEKATVSTVLTNRTGVAQSGKLTLGLPDGWSTPDPVSYHLNPGRRPRSKPS